MALEIRERIHSVPRWGWWAVGGISVLAFFHATKVKKQKALALAQAQAAAREAAAHEGQGGGWGGPAPGAHPDYWAGGSVGGMHTWTNSPVGPPEQLPPMPMDTPPYAGASKVDEAFFGLGGPALSGGQHYMDTFFPGNSPPPMGRPRGGPGPHRHKAHQHQHDQPPDRYSPQPAPPLGV